jgi:hypothetical protein
MFSETSTDVIIKKAWLYQRKVRRLGKFVYASLHFQTIMFPVMGTRDGMELAQKHPSACHTQFSLDKFQFKFRGGKIPCQEVALKLEEFFSQNP